MTSATISTKGQITIPAVVREALSVGPGDRLEFVQIEAGQYLLVAANRSVTELKGMFGKQVKNVAVEEMGGVKPFLFAALLRTEQSRDQQLVPRTDGRS